MTSKPPIGSLVTHRRVGSETMYRVTRASIHSNCVIVKHVSGPFGNCDNNRAEFPDGWNAAIEYLTLALPSRVMVPEGL